MSNIKYTQDHEIIKIEGDIVTIGITEYAQDALGDLVFIELPSVGKKVSEGDEFSVVESVKIASEIYTPISGEVVEVNTALENDVEVLKGDIETGWIVKIKADDISSITGLMTEAEYKDYIKTLD